MEGLMVGDNHFLKMFRHLLSVRWRSYRKKVRGREDKKRYIKELGTAAKDGACLVI